MAKSILVLGAGRSSSALISYLIEHGKKHDWIITVGDVSPEAARERVGNQAKAILFDIRDMKSSMEAIQSADVVISMIPASLHSHVARICLSLSKHLLTASYVSEEMISLHKEAVSKDLLFLNECGLDPGIDHMSAMQLIDRIKEKGGELLSFESFTGGLIAPETDPENPWRYKFTWNPRNVVMAGQGTAKFLRQGQFKFIPYQQLFRRITPVTVSGYGEYEGYANRDSLKYRESYGLQNIQTMLRGTLRNKGYCNAWNVLVQLGCTDDSYLMEGVASMSHRDFVNSFLDFDHHRSVEEKIILQFDLKKDGPEFQRLSWSGFFSKESIGLAKGTPAQILEHILNKKWKLNPDDKDFVVMWHRFVFNLEGRKKEIQASLVSKGDDAVNTAMAKTVGLPLAIAAKLLLEGKIKTRGVVIPTTKDFYEPILEELKSLGIELNEREI
jgi:saccharopine dehydrogenase-like NADP-dependent oxidoreductase